MLNRIGKKYGAYWQLYTFLLLPVGYIILFCYVPMAGLQIAFKDFDLGLGIWGSPWVGFDNIQKFLSAYQFARVIRNTLSLSLYAIITAFPFPILFALTLNTMDNVRLKKTVQTITYMPHFISTVVLVGMMMQVFHPLVGIYGIFYKSVTGQVASDIFASPNAFPHLYVWSGIWQNFGYNSIIYIAALTNVSAELHEAAQIDGASRFQRVLHIDIPALLPTIVIMLILRMGSVMSIGFEKVYLMQNDLNLTTSEIISTFVYKKGIAAGASNDYSYAAGIGMFNSVVNLVLVISVNGFARKLGDTSLW